MRFAKWVFTGAAIYGFIVLAPLYFLESTIAKQTGPITYPEYFYGFIGTALAFQVLFVIIGRDPVRLRAAMPACFVEKIVFPAAAWPLFLGGRTSAMVAAFSSVDLVLLALFVAAWIKTRTEA